MLLVLADPAFAITRFVDNATSGCSTPTDTDYNPATRSCGAGSSIVHNTLNVAVSATVGGDIVEIRAGTYTSEYIQTPPSGSPSQYTIFRGYQNERPLFTHPGGQGVDFVWFGAPRSYIEIRQLEINGYDYGVRFLSTSGGGPVTHIRFINNKLHDTYRNGLLWGGGSSDLYWAENEVYRIGSRFPAYRPGVNGMYGVGPRALIERNVFHDCVTAVTIYTSVPANNGPQDDVIIRNNVAYNMARQDLHSWMEVGQQMGPVFGALALAARTQIYNNIIYNSNGKTVGSSLNNGIIGMANSGAVTDSRIYNNTIYNVVDGGWAIGIGAEVGTGHEVRNNIAYQTGGISIGAGRGTASNNLTTDPSFVNAAGADFSLTSGSPAINAGTTTGLPTGRFSNGLPDQGAHETFVPTLAQATGNNIDITLGMSGYVPVQVTTAGWTVNNGRTVTSAVRLPSSDSIVRLTFSGAPCASSETWTVSYTPGATTDSALIGGAIGNKNQRLNAITNLSVNASACTGGGGGSPPANSGIIYDMNSISGTNVPDTSGNANHGTTTGSPTVVTGLIDDALSFADGVDDFITAPHGSGIDPTTQSGTYCILVSPDSTTDARTYMGTPFGTNQRFFLSTISGTWAFGIQGSTIGQNNDFPVSSGWQFPCIEFNATTDKATLIVNATRGTTENGTTGASIKPYTSYTFAGNLTIGKANGFVTSVSPGGDIDHFVYYPNVLTQQEMTELYQSLIPPPPPPESSVRKQAAHQWERPYYKGGVAEALRVVNGDAQVMRGGFVDLVVQIDCEDDDCPSFSPRLYRSIDDGATYSQVNDLCGVTCFRGDSSDPDLVRGTVECCLTGALTENDGPTNFTTAAVPSVTLSQDHSFTLRYKLKVDSSATPGQVIYFKVFDQNGNALEGAYTPTLGAKLTVKDYSNGGGF